MNTTDEWAGEFGNEYTVRNRVNWRKRVPFWREIIMVTGARSVFEVGCNAGWNLSAINMVYGGKCNLMGCDVNGMAIEQACSAGLEIFHGEIVDLKNMAELVFTAGVLIHIHPDHLQETMQQIVDHSYDYVLAVEYEAEQEQEVEYRGRRNMLWKRDYGKLYSEMGLEQVYYINNPLGFDYCSAWLMRKP